jgi:hypothetical protein
LGQQSGLALGQRGAHARYELIHRFRVIFCVQAPETHAEITQRSVEIVAREQFPRSLHSSIHAAVGQCGGDGVDGAHGLLERTMPNADGAFNG